MSLGMILIPPLYGKHACSRDILLLKRNLFQEIFREASSAAELRN
jgi:hypothetical protein